MTDALKNRHETMTSATPAAVNLIRELRERAKIAKMEGSDTDSLTMTTAADAISALTATRAETLPPSLHDRVLRAISIRTNDGYSDIVTAAARLLVATHQMEANEGLLDKLHEDEEYCLLVADIDNETCCLVDDEKAEIAALRSAIETAQSMGQESLAEDLEKLLAQMADYSAAFAEPT